MTLIFKDRSLQSSYVEGSLNNYIFRIGLHRWPKTGKRSKHHSMEFNFFRIGGKFLRTQVFYLNIDKNDSKLLIRFLENVVPRSIEAVMLVKIVIEQAVDRQYFLYSQAYDFFKWSFQDPELGEDVDERDVFTTERLSSIKNWMPNYFVLGLGCSFAVVEALMWYVTNHEVKIVRK
jgi:hypothetical protein